MSKALIEKAAREYYFSLLPQGNMPTIIGCSIENTPEYRAFIAGANWQREQLEAEIIKLKEQIREQYKTVGILRENYKVDCDELEQKVKAEVVGKIKELANNKKHNMMFTKKAEASSGKPALGFDYKDVLCIDDLLSLLDEIERGKE